MNPIRVEDILDVTEYLLNPDYLICTTLETHNAIHYGNSNNLSKSPIQRTKMIHVLGDIKIGGKPNE